MSDQEWQPARFKPTHRRDMQTGTLVPVDENTLETIKKTVFLIKPIEDGDLEPATLEFYRARGCEAQKLYIVKNHSLDCGNVMCEHEILTD